MKINVTITPSEVNDRTLTFDLDELGHTEYSWEQLDYSERSAAVEKRIGEIDQPYWDVEDFSLPFK